MYQNWHISVEHYQVGRLPLYAPPKCNRTDKFWSNILAVHYSFTLYQNVTELTDFGRTFSAVDYSFMPCQNGTELDRFRSNIFGGWLQLYPVYQNVTEHRFWSNFSGGLPLYALYQNVTEHRLWSNIFGRVLRRALSKCNRTDRFWSNFPGGLRLYALSKCNRTAMCDVNCQLIPIVCWFYRSALGLILFQTTDFGPTFSVE